MRAVQVDEASGSPIVAAWVLEEALSVHRKHVAVGDELETAAVALRADRCPAVLRALRLPRPRWQLLPAGRESPARRLHGRIGSLHAVTAAHRLDESGLWVPDAPTARTRPVTSTCEVDPARSVWAPSGQPVLLGFLLMVEDVTAASSAPTAAAPPRAARPGGRRTPAPV